MLIEQWRREYNTVRPHSSLGYLPPAPEAIRPDPKLLNLPLLLGPHPRQNEAARFSKCLSSTRFSHPITGTSA